MLRLLRMKTHLTSKRILPVLLCLGLVFSAAGPLDFTPSAEAATSAQKRKLRKFKRKARRFKKQTRILRRRLAAALAKEAAALAQVPKPPQLEMVSVPAGVLAENPADSTTYGAVPYDFQIGKYEVSLEEYAAFLNAVGKTDAGEPDGLYNLSMEANDNIKGIARSGINGSYVYTVIGSGNRPVTYVSWFDAARFCNWLHNGCPTGLQGPETTERGAYTLDGATSGVDFSRNPGAKYWIPSEDEWYKAAYHDPQSQADGGPPGGDFYWLYPTKSDTVPGNTIGPLPLANHANFFTTVMSVTQAGYVSTENYLTDGGSYPGSPSYYGTCDQGGNVWEWNDAVIGGSFRGLRGGSWGFSESSLRSSNRNGNNPVSELNDSGFRIASP